MAAQIKNITELELLVSIFDLNTFLKRVFFFNIDIAHLQMKYKNTEKHGLERQIPGII